MLSASGEGHRSARPLIAALTVVLALAGATVALGASGGWVTDRAPTLAVFSQLDGVSCGGPAACVAVGLALPSHAIAEHWNGTRWTLEPAPATPARVSGLMGVSCTSPTACVAVGSTSRLGKHPRSTPLAERWNGSRWRLERTPKLRGIFDGVSCVSAADCVAVGETANGSDTLIEHWDGRRWSLERPASPAAGRILSGVSCTAPDDCIAVGTTSHDGETPLAERWNGVRWTQLRVPLPPAVAPATAVSGFNAVSCVGPSRCVAVGNYASSGPNPQPLAAVWSGRGWVLRALRHNRPELNLTGVACLATDSCQAVGYGLHGTLALGWNGTRWTVEATPPSRLEASFPSELDAVAAIPGGGYTAVGYQHQTRTLIERLRQ